jgi:hypothetical protein
MTYKREANFTVQLGSKLDAKPAAGSPLVAVDLTKRCYCLVLHNRGCLFLVRPFKGAAAADLQVLIIPWGQVRLSGCSPNLDICA